MATRAQKTKVGLFVLGCGALIIGSAAVISGFTTTSTSKYWIEFNDSILGLGVGGLVEYLGVPVGTIRDIKVNPSNHAMVQIEVDDEKVRLREGVTAQVVLYSLATGSMAISLEGGAAEQPELEEGAQIPVNTGLNIRSMTNTAGDVITQVSELLGELQEIARKLNESLDGMDKGQLTEIVKDVKGITEEAKSFIGEAKDSLKGLEDSLQRATGEFTKVAEDAQSLADDLGEFVGDARQFVQTAQQKLEPLDVAALQVDLKEVVANINGVTEKLEATMTKVEDMGDGLSHTTDNLEFSLRDTLNSATEAFDSINSLVEVIEQDPASVLRGRKGKDER